MISCSTSSNNCLLYTLIFRGISFSGQIPQVTSTGHIDWWQGKTVSLSSKSSFCMVMRHIWGHGDLYPHLWTTSFPGSLILPPRVSEERPWLGLVTCHFENWEQQGGVLCNQQFVALSFVEFKVSRCDCHYPRRLSIFSFQADISNNIYSNVYRKVKQVWLEAI